MGLFDKIKRGSPDDDETLLERGVEIHIGGLTNPVMDEVEGLITRGVEVLTRLSDKEAKKLEEIKEHGASVAMVKDLARLKPVKEFLEDELGRVVGEDAEYVRTQMSPRQVTKVATAYIRAVGFEEIRDLFLATRAQLSKKTAAAPEATGADPSQAQ
jgi:C4-type Zn-finger protein